MASGMKTPPPHEVICDLSDLFLYEEEEYSIPVVTSNGEVAQQVLGGEVAGPARSTVCPTIRQP